MYLPVNIKVKGCFHWIGCLVVFQIQEYQSLPQEIARSSVSIQITFQLTGNVPLALDIEWILSIYHFKHPDCVDICFFSVSFLVAWCYIVNILTAGNLKKNHFLRIPEITSSFPFHVQRWCLGHHIKPNNDISSSIPNFLFGRQQSAPLSASEMQ